MFDQAMARIAGRFRRVEPRATTRAFVLGLLSGVERKNCWRLAEQADHARPGPMQRLLRTARWDADALRDDVRTYVHEHLGTDNAVLIVDETGFLKKGAASAGVQRQYTGTAGRIENSQVGVFLAYASSRRRALIDRRLYLPDTSWSRDLERRTRAGVPEHVEFATKPKLAGQMIVAALDAGINTSRVTGDGGHPCGHSRSQGDPDAPLADQAVALLHHEPDRRVLKVRVQLDVRFDGERADAPAPSDQP